MTAGPGGDAQGVEQKEYDVDICVEGFWIKLDTVVLFFLKHQISAFVGMSSQVYVVWHSTVSSAVQS